ncbi:Nudix hydrolase 27 [Citrus sinensis]|uniref:Nudix hydrolase 27 n=1 Tax=Citrus sinensis TaxID=2711 RepID=A0ACB8K0L8_CITSI|nr:Nudix hydrolase 27 [Citrus sinensis]
MAVTGVSGNSLFYRVVVSQSYPTKLVKFASVPLELQQLPRAGFGVDNNRLRYGYLLQSRNGGADEGEDLINAALRELREETGVTSAEFLAETPYWLTYDFPLKVKQKLNRRWGTNYKGYILISLLLMGNRFLFKFTGKEEEINLLGDGSEKPEFNEWRKEGEILFECSVYLLYSLHGWLPWKLLPYDKWLLSDFNGVDVFNQKQQSD